MTLYYRGLSHLPMLCVGPHFECVYSYNCHDKVEAGVQILSAAEEREKQVVALEEEVARRRRDLEHEHSSRLAEAEATVRRLQVAPHPPRPPAWAIVYLVQCMFGLYCSMVCNILPVLLWYCRMAWNVLAVLMTAMVGIICHLKHAHVPLCSGCYVACFQFSSHTTK